MVNQTKPNQTKPNTITELDMLGVGFFVAYCVASMVVFMWAAKTGVDQFVVDHDRWNRLFVALQQVYRLPFIIFATVAGSCFGLCVGVACGVWATYMILETIGWVAITCVALFIDGLITVRDERM